jgi:transposase
VFNHKDLKLDPPQIARALKMNKNSVENTIDKYEKTGTVHDRPKTGRKRKLSTKEVKQAVKKAKKGKARLKLLAK